MNLLGSPFDFLIAFFAGFLASLTPCVYPIIPISAGLIVGHAHYSRGKRFLLSLAYTTGIAITYSFLGILAVLTGSIFGKFSSSPVVTLISGILILIFGIFMFELFNFNCNFELKFPALKKGSYVSALTLGFASGLMISPCLSPILASILTYLTASKSISYGLFLLFCFSYGLGLIFTLLGTFGSSLIKLPKPGKWMVVVKRVCASVIVLSGAYFIFTALRRF